MPQQTYDFKSSLVQGAYDGSGQTQSSTECVRTRAVFAADTALYNVSVAAQVILPLPISGSTDGDDNIKIPSLIELGVSSYLNNPNYKVTYYWFWIRRLGYDDEHDGNIWRVGSCVTVEPIAGGNKADEKPLLYGKQNLSYSANFGGSNSTDYDECSVSGNYLKYTKNGTVYETTVAQFILGNVLVFNPDTDQYIATSHAVRDSEFEDAEAAILGYTSQNTNSLIFDLRWQSTDTVLDMSEYMPYNYLNIVLRVDESTAITPDYITSAVITMQSDPWQLGNDNILHLAPIPEPINSDIFTEPYPASMWYYDSRLGRLNMFLLPEELIDIPLAAERPKRINVYDISEPQNGFKHNGLAILMPIECISDKEEAGRWDLTLVHPIDDYKKWTYIVGQNVLKVNSQLYRIDTTEIYQDADQSYITAHAKHITYDLFDGFVDELKGEVDSGGSFARAVIQRAQTIITTHRPEVNEYSFDVTSNITGPILMDIHDQTVIGALFGDDNSLASRYGGQVYRDNFHISINTTLEGAPPTPAFKLRYGTDLTKLSYKIDFSEWVTELICKDNHGNLWGISYPSGHEWIIHHEKTRIIHFTYDSQLSDADAYDCLVKDGYAYWATVNTPTVSIEVSIANLKNDPKYKDFVDLQNLDVGYVGTVYFEQFNINVDLKIVSIRRDELTGDALQVVLGTARGSFIRSPVMSQTIVANGTVLGKQELEMQAMKDRIDDLNIKQMRTWGGMSAYKWSDVQKYKWGEIYLGHKNRVL